MKRSLLWLACALAVTPFAWSFLASAVHTLLAPSGYSSLRIFFGGALYGSVYGAHVVFVLGVPYSAVLLAWPSFARRFPH